MNVNGETVLQVVATVVSVSAVVLGAGWKLAVKIATLDTKFDAMSNRIDKLETQSQPTPQPKRRR